MIDASSVARRKTPAFSLPCIWPVKLSIPGILANGTMLSPENLPLTAMVFSSRLANRENFSNEPFNCACASVCL